MDPNGGLVREFPLFQGNLGWWNIKSKYMSGFVPWCGNLNMVILIRTSVILSCMSISNNYWCIDSLNLGKPSKPKYAIEQQDENVALIRSSFRAEMSNFSNSLKYLSKLLNFQVFAVTTERDSTSAHLFGFSQQSGLCYRPQMKLQKLTQDNLRKLGAIAKPAAAFNHVPCFSNEHVIIDIPLLAGDTPDNCARQYTAYHSYLKRRKKERGVQATPWMSCIFYLIFLYRLNLEIRVSEYLLPGSMREPGHAAVVTGGRPSMGKSDGWNIKIWPVLKCIIKRLFTISWWRSQDWRRKASREAHLRGWSRFMSRRSWPFNKSWHFSGGSQLAWEGCGSHVNI